MDKYFRSYGQAFLSQDSSLVAAFYLFPVTFFTESGQVVILDQSEFNDNTGKLFDIYTGLGVIDVNFEIVSLVNTNDLFKQVSIQWSFLDSGGFEIYSSLSRYLIQSDANKIVSVTAVDEMTKISALRQA